MNLKEKLKEILKKNYGITSDTPYFTMEYNKGRVIQCRGSHNCEMPSSVKTFVAAFEKLMKEREEKIERKCG